MGFIHVGSEFAINCGSSQSIVSSDGVLYDSNNESLTTASYYVTEIEKWGVSNVGTFIDASIPNYILGPSSSQFANTLNSELFQTARTSASSLRYYGLGLENGEYTVKLSFAEIGFSNDDTWKSLGKRIFDIYIQVFL